MDKYTEAVERLNAKRKSANELVERKPDLDWTADELKGFQDAQAEINDLAVQVEQLRSVKEAAEGNKKALEDANRPQRNIPFQSDGDGVTPDERKAGSRKSIGQAFIESASYKGFNPRQQGSLAFAESPEIGWKATFTTAGSTLTEYDRQGSMVMVNNERLTVADLLASGTTNSNTIRYIQEDTYTNAATAVAEEGLKPEASFDLSEVDAVVRKIAVVGRVTDEFFQDFPAMQSYINERLRFMVEEKEEAYLLNGTGVAPQIEGILHYSTIQSQAKGADPTPDAIYKAMILIMTNAFLDPTGVVFHPLDWQDVRLLRTTDGIYIWGNPADAGPERIWGLPVVITTAMTQNTALVGAFKMGAQIFRREGIRVESTNSDASDFQYNRIAIRAEERLALAMYRPKAFCKVTGI